MQSPDTQMKIQLWRQKVVDGTLTQDDMKEAIQVLRADRVNAAASSASSHARRAPAKAKAAINSDSLLDELGDI